VIILYEFGNPDNSPKLDSVATTVTTAFTVGASFSPVTFILTLTILLYTVPSYALTWNVICVASIVSIESNSVLYIKKSPTFACPVNPNASISACVN
jgi:hypothetical protein